MVIEKKLIAIVMLGFIAFAAACGCAIAQRPPESAKRSEVYTVRSGDTLWQIAEIYLDKNTYGPQYLPDYLEGIRQNPENKAIFEDRSRPLQIGDKVVMVYWVKEDEG